MNSLDAIGRLILIMGAFMVLVGVLLMVAGKIGGLGRLPGDIFFQKGNFTFYFPVVTMIIISVVLTLVFNLFFRK